MRLPWRRARGQESAAEEPRPGMDAALAAVHAARAAVSDARSRGEQVADVLEKLGSLRRENHISDRLARAVRDGYGEGGHAGP